MQAAIEITAADSTTTCGQIGVLDDQGGRPFCGANDMVALRIAKDEESIAMIIKAQLKPIPRRANLASRTLVLMPYTVIVSLVRFTYHDWGTHLTKSLACSFSVSFSRFSRISSSLKVGLSGFSIFLAGVPGTLIALLRGDFGVMGMLTDSRLESPLI
jgi:hypothetical protein